MTLKLFDCEPGTNFLWPLYFNLMAHNSCEIIPIRLSTTMHIQRWLNTKSQLLYLTDLTIDFITRLDSVDCDETKPSGATSTSDKVLWRYSYNVDDQLYMSVIRPGLAVHLYNCYSLCDYDLLSPVALRAASHFLPDTTRGTKFCAAID